MDDSDEEFAIEDIYDLPAEELRELLDSNTAPQSFIPLIQRELAEREQTDRIAHALLEGGTLPSSAVPSALTPALSAPLTNAHLTLPSAVPSALTPALSAPLTNAHLTTLTPSSSPAVSSTAPPTMGAHHYTPALGPSASLPHAGRDDDRARQCARSNIECGRPIKPASTMDDVVSRQQSTDQVDSYCASSRRDNASDFGSSCHSAVKKNVLVSRTRSLLGNFKPTPVAFDFIIGKSSVKKQKVVKTAEEAPKRVWGSSAKKKKEPVVVSKGNFARQPSKEASCLKKSAQQTSKDARAAECGKPTSNSCTKGGPPLGGKSSGRGKNTGAMDAKERKQQPPVPNGGSRTMGTTTTDGSDQRAVANSCGGVNVKKVPECNQQVVGSDDVDDSTRVSEDGARVVPVGDAQPSQTQVGGAKVIYCHQEGADEASELIYWHQEGTDEASELIYCHEENPQDDTCSPRVMTSRQHGALAEGCDHDAQKNSTLVGNKRMAPTLYENVLHGTGDTALARDNTIPNMSRQDSVPRAADSEDDNEEMSLHDQNVTGADEDVDAIIDDVDHVDEDVAIEDAYSEDAVAEEDYSEHEEKVENCAVHAPAACEAHMPHELSTITSIEEDIAAPLVSRSSSGSIPVLISTPEMSAPVSTRLEALVPESAAEVPHEDNARAASHVGGTAPCAPVRPPPALCAHAEKDESGNARNDELSAPVAGAAPGVPQKSRKPPVPRCTKISSKSRGAFKLDYCGLEENDIVDYSDVFTNVSSLFTDAAPIPARLRDIIDQYRAFCNIVTQFDSNVDGNYTRADGLANENSAFTDVFLRSLAGGTTAQDHAPARCNTRFFKVVQHRTEVYNIVTRALHRKVGWEEMPHGMGKGAQVWNLLWTWSKPRVDYGKLFVWQKVNHYPQNKNLTRKDTLKRCIERYTRSGTKAASFFNILPKTFILPKEYVAFVDAFTLAEDAKDGNLWIMKPAVASRGRGIQLINNVQYVSYSELTVIQQYISRPLLLDELKWDLRVYVLVTSFQPLEAFFYKDGFARFATVPYTLQSSELKNRFIHLTNSSVNRLNKDVDTTDAQLLGGTKINFEALKKKLAAVGVPWSAIWRKMIEVVLKSLVMAGDHIPHQANSFEVFGYDIIFDDTLEAWLIEVNASPSLNLEHLLDEQVKLPLIDDTLDIVSPPQFDREALTTCLVRGERDQKQLNIDLTKILAGKELRKYGELPEKIGNYHPIAPSKALDHVMKVRAQLFSK